MITMQTQVNCSPHFMWLSSKRHSGCLPLRHTLHLAVGTHHSSGTLPTSLVSPHQSRLLVFPHHLDLLMWEWPELLTCPIVLQFSLPVIHFFQVFTCVTPSTPSDLYLNVPICIRHLNWVSLNLTWVIKLSITQFKFASNLTNTPNSFPCFTFFHSINYHLKYSFLLCRYVNI